MLEKLKKLACTYAETQHSPRLANLRKADLFEALEKREAEFAKLSSDLEAALSKDKGETS